jgi:hypothetical protein
MPGSNQFKTEIYHRGVVMMLPWKNQRQFERGKALLDRLAGRPHRADELYYLEDEQYEALLDFRRELRQEP